LQTLPKEKPATNAVVVVAPSPCQKKVQSLFNPRESDSESSQDSFKGDREELRLDMEDPKENIANTFEKAKMKFGLFSKPKAQHWTSRSRITLKKFQR
jgi:hypothetical protein